MELSHWKPSATAMRWLGGGVTSLLALAVMAYAAFWMPYQQPQKSVPRIVSILPEQPLPETRDDELDEYGWVEPRNGVARIPVSVAMELVRERLPVRPDAAEQLQRVASDNIPTDAGSGRRVLRPDDAP